MSESERKQYNKLITRITKEQDIDIRFVEGVLDLFYHLEQGGIVDFSVVERTDCGEAYWLQAERYNKELNKVIIIDYDFNKMFDDVDGVIDAILSTNERMREIGEKVYWKKKDA